MHTGFFFLFCTTAVVLSYRCLMDLLSDGEVSGFLVALLFLMYVATITASIRAGHGWFTFH